MLFLFKSFNNLSQKVVIANSAELFFLNPNWNGVNILFFAMNLDFFVQIFSNDLGKHRQLENGAKNSFKNLKDEVLGFGIT